MAKGYTEKRSYACNRCKTSYSTAKAAKACFDKGLPKILPPGTTYHRKSGSQDEYFLIEFNATGTLMGGLNRNHERIYIVGSFPETSLGAGYELVYATASFDGRSLHDIEGVHSKGGLIPFGRDATRVSDSALKKLLEDESFRKAHEKAASFGKFWKAF